MDKVLFFSFLALQFLSRASASLDLYLDYNDTQSLFGMPSQLWYVQQGHMNINALKYVIVVPYDVKNVSFYWQSHNSNIPYTTVMGVNDTASIHSKLINMSPSSFIPRKLSKWKVSLICKESTTHSVFVNISIKFPVKLPSSDIVIQFQKLCSETQDGLNLEKKKSPIVFVYVTVACLLLFVICMAYWAAFGRRKTDKVQDQGLRVISESNRKVESRSSHRDANQSIANASSSNETEPLCARSSPVIIKATSGSVISSNKSLSHYTSLRSGNVEAKIEGLAGDESALTLVSTVAEGTFGKVHRGFYSINPNEDPLSVIVKSVSEHASDVQRKVLLTEGTMLRGLNHPNLLQIVAVLTPEGNSPSVLFNSESDVNLKKYLGSCQSLMTKDAVSLGVQVLNGLSFLHSKRFLHQDIACRNCMVDENLRLKLADCALSRDLFPSDYFCLGDNENRPVKWMAYECLVENAFSPSSDVWAWAVLVWEVMTLGHQPYVEIDPFEMVNVLRQGVRLAQPFNCPDELFKALTFCWATESEERPNVTDLLLYLNGFLEHLNRYV